MFDHFKLLPLTLPVPLIRDAGLGNWDTESCQTLETLPAHTKCQCRQLATFAILAQLPRDLVGDWDEPAGNMGCGWGVIPGLWGLAKAGVPKGDGDGPGAACRHPGGWGGHWRVEGCPPSPMGRTPVPWHPKHGLTWARGCCGL